MKTDKFIIIRPALQEILKEALQDWHNKEILGSTKEMEGATNGINESRC